MYDRGDLSAPDFIQTDLTLDSTWRDMDLSAIVPVGAKWVHLGCALSNPTANKIMFFRTKGQTSSPSTNAPGIRSQVANQAIDGDFFLRCNDARVIQYFIDSGSTLSIEVRGWLIQG
jgi:hypothetical protein